MVQSADVGKKWDKPWMVFEGFTDIPYCTLRRIGVRRGMPKGVEDCRRPPSVWAGHSQNSCKAVSGVARQQGVEG
jgi:hypothetical protein